MSGVYSKLHETGAASPKRASDRKGRKFGFGLALAALIVPAVIAQVTAHQPAVAVTSPPVNLFTPSTGYPNLGRVGVDKLGNVFYSDSGILYEILATLPVATQTPTPLVTGLGANNGQAVTVDANGNLWVSNGSGQDSGAGVYSGLILIPTSTTGVPNTALVANGMTGTSVNSITAACNTSNFTALCAYGNMGGNNITSYYVQLSDIQVLVSGGTTTVYVVDYLDNNTKTSGYGCNYSRIFSFTTANPNTGTLIADQLPCNNSGGNLAVDQAGNVYYADTKQGNNGGGGTGELFNFGTHTGLSGGSTSGSFTGVASYQVTTPPTIATAGAANTAVQGIGTDQYGNLFITSSTQISEAPYESTADSFTDEFGIVSGLTTNAIFSPTVDANGNIYFAGYHGLLEMEVGGHNFGTQAVGNNTPITGPAMTLYFNTSTTISGNYFPTGSPTSNSYTGLLQSFPYSGTKTCAGGTTYTAGQTCTTTTDFQPIHPGLLKGSYTPRTNSTNDVIVNLQGVGVAPEALFLPGTTAALFSSANQSSSSTAQVSLNDPLGIAVDTYGDIFVADSGNGKVVADCLSTTVVTVAGSGSGGAANSFCGNSGYTGAVLDLGTGFTTPSAIALDGANNLYVTDSAANSVTLIQSVNLGATTPITSTTTFGGIALSGPKGIAVDGYANIYIADTGNNRIVEAHQFGAAATDNVVYVASTTTFAGTKLSSPTGLAFDASGDLFIADKGNNRVVEITSLGVASVVPTGMLALSAPTGLAVLPSGALVVSDSTNGVSVLNGTASLVLATGSLTATGAQGIALDLDGDIYVSNTSADNVLEVNTTAPTVTFQNTDAGSTSAAMVTQVNDAGNASLVLNGLAVSSNFMATNSSTCTSTSTVTIGSACTLDLELTPGSTVSPATVIGSVTLTVNELGYSLVTSTSNETASFGTSGTEVETLTGTVLSASGTGSTAQTITFTPPATPVSYGVAPITLSATSTSGLAVTFTLTQGSSIASISGSTLTITGTGTITIVANQAGNSTYAPATQVTVSIVVNPASQTINFTAPTTSVTYGVAPITLQATATSGLAVSFSLTQGSTIASISGNTLTITGAGTITIAANQVGNTNYSAATQVTQTIVVNPASQTVTFTAPPTPVTFGVAPITLQATATSGLAVTFSLTQGSTIASITGDTLTITGAGTITVGANQVGNTNYSAATQVTRTIVVNTASQTITFPTLASPVVYSGVSAISLGATASSGLAIAYSVTGPASISGSTLTITGVGSVNVTASQSGNTSYAAATPISQTIVVNPPPTFSMTVAPASLTVQPGGYGVATATITAANGFNSAVTFACSGQQAGVVCSFSPATLTPTGTAPAVSTLTIYAPIATAMNRKPASFWPESTVACAMLLILPFIKRRRLAAFLLVFCLGGLGMLTGCGSYTPPAPTTSTVTVTAATVSGSVQETGSIALTVQ